MLVTTVEPNSGFELEVPEVMDTESECTLLGEWTVDNGSLQYESSVFELEYFKGQIRITFRDDGNAEVVYDNFEFRVFQDDTLSVGGIEIERHEEFTRTTNAQGVTTYEVFEDNIVFGDFSERNYLVGIEEVRHIREFAPENVIGANTDETTERNARGYALFSGARQFELGFKGSTLRFLNGSDPATVLNRSGSADGEEP